MSFRGERIRGERKKIDLGKYSIVVYEAGGHKFEVIVDPREALEYYKGQKRPENVIILYEIYHDYQKGERVSIEEVRNIARRALIEKAKEKKGRALSKDEIKEIESLIDKLDDDKLKELAAKYILEKGRLKIPKALRDELLEKLEKRIISYLQKYAINPATKAPYPPKKIEEALQQIMSGKGGARIVLDPLKGFEEQLPDVIKALKEVLPIRLEIIVSKVRVPAQYTGIAYPRLEKYGSVKESKWLDDGSLEAIVEVPGGQFMMFHNVLSEATRGTVRVDVIERKIIG